MCRLISPLQISARQMSSFPMSAHLISPLQIQVHLAEALPVSAYLEEDGADFYQMIL
jgi:hypothetical protein